MLVVMEKNASDKDVDHVCEVITQMGYQARPMPGQQRIAIGVVGNRNPVEQSRLLGLPGVKEAIPVSKPYKLVSREFKSTDTIVELPNGAMIGGPHACLIGGPCSVESKEQVTEVAEVVAKAGGRILRGGAYKPRTSPYAFQGHGHDALRMMSEAAKQFGLATVSEAINESTAEEVAEYIDIIQIGARNMQNYALLKKVGSMTKPVMLKRGMAATIEEWLLAAEYILDAGNTQVILCERGIRSFDKTTRNVLDIAAIPLVQGLSHLPVVADPSHGTGVREMVVPMAKAAMAAGAHGVIVETHPRPEVALSDGHQALLPEAFIALGKAMEAAAMVGGRRLQHSQNRAN
ncbi:MAG: 3-deoxy-7-phosphoheptulonate synthase [Myxococcales bacterium]|nr:3-deoxy-7-phosphoheptulonate synthase [Myxococcales bacterium]